MAPIEKLVDSVRATSDVNGFLRVPSSAEFLDQVSVAILRLVFNIRATKYPLTKHQIPLNTTKSFSVTATASPLNNH